jgi:hypothetical protein
MPFSLGAAAVAVASSHQADMNGIRAAQLAKAIRAFRDLDPNHPIKSWIDNVGERVYVALSSGQEAAAERAADYTRRALLVQHLDAIIPDINAENFAGIASDGRDLESLLAGAAIRVSHGKRQGMSNAQAMQAGEAWLRMVVSTQIQDAGRAADSVAIATADATKMTAEEVRQQGVRDGLSDRERLLQQLREARQPTGLSPSRQADVQRRKQETLDRLARQRAERQAAKTPPAKMVSKKRVEVGYIRLLTPPSCPRCVILAGRFYRWSDGFKRHPNCDCVHIPATRELDDDLTSDPQQYFDSLSEAEQDRQFGKANAQAIRDGASISKVVNAQSGMRTADDGRRYTTVGTKKTRRGPRGGPPVLRPTVWQIYKDASGNRERAKSLLQTYGYITNR